MITDILVVFLTIIGLGTVFYWILKFAFWFMEKINKKSDDYETMREKNYAAMVEEMKQFDQQTLNLAYLYARSLITYGVDVTEKWDTAVQQTANLEKAYRKGFYEGIAAKLKEDKK